MATIETPVVPVPTRGAVSFAGLDADRTVVWLSGEHDVSTVPALSDTIARAIALDGADLVIDLSGVDFIGAATVSVIIRAHGFLKLRSRSLVLRSPSPSAKRVIELCGLAELLDRPVVVVPRLPDVGGALGSWVAVPATDHEGP